MYLPIAHLVWIENVMNANKQNIFVATHRKLNTNKKYIPTVLFNKSITDIQQIVLRPYAVLITITSALTPGQTTEYEYLTVFFAEY